MSFIGPVNRLGSMFVRPHDVQIRHLPGDGAEEAMVERIVHLGFEVRVELTLADGDGLWAQITRAQAEELELAPNQIIYVRPSTSRIFDGNGASRHPTTEELAAA
jgi:sulfate transport system ATP-binding protein